MKQFSVNPDGTISRAAARNAFLVNQFATPGLGSLMARRWIAGTGQLLLASAGFVFVLIWFFKIMIQYYGQISGNVVVKPVGWIGATGGILFAVSWIWSLVTSLDILAKAKKEDAPAEKLPPKL